MYTDYAIMYATETGHGLDTTTIFARDEEQAREVFDSTFGKIGFRILAIVKRWQR